MDLRILLISFFALFIISCSNQKDESSDSLLLGTWIQDSTNRTLLPKEHLATRLFDFKENSQLLCYNLNRRRNKAYKTNFIDYEENDSLLFLDYNVTGGLSFPENYGSYKILKTDPNNAILIAQFNTSDSRNPYEDSIIYLRRTKDLQKFKNLITTRKPTHTNLDIKKLLGFWKHDSTEQTMTTKLEKYQYLQFHQVDSLGGIMSTIWNGRKPNKRSLKFELYDHNFIVKDDTLPIMILTDSSFVMGIDNKVQYEAMHYSKVEPNENLPDSLIK
jgi:hypothetical protein